MTGYLAALALAHVLADFVLQGDGLLRARRALRPGAHAAHGATLLLVALAVQVPYLLHGRLGAGQALAVAVTVAGVHAVQDYVKDRLEARGRLAQSRLAVLAVDQFLHLAVLAAAAAAVAGPLPAVPALARLLSPAAYERLVLAALILTLDTAAAGTVLRLALEPFRPASLGSGQATASFWIGVCERLLLTAAIAAGSPALPAASFVVAAKAAFRFRDVDEPGHAHYYLLGTLASVTVATLAGLALRLVVASAAPWPA